MDEAGTVSKIVVISWPLVSLVVLTITCYGYD